MIKITRWGHSIGLRLPCEVAQAAGLKPRDYVYVRLLDSGDSRVRPVKNVQPAHPPTSTSETGVVEATLPTSAGVTTW